MGCGTALSCHSNPCAKVPDVVNGNPDCNPDAGGAPASALGHQPVPCNGPPDAAVVATPTRTGDWSSPDPSGG